MTATTTAMASDASVKTSRAFWERLWQTDGTARSGW
jgi:hypothetical protein